MADESSKVPLQKFEVFLKLFLPVMGVIAVAIIGHYGQQYLEKRQNEELRARLYTQLISEREQAESQLRANLFIKIMERFWKSEGSRLEDDILNLELLVHNFHESLNLKPLFMHTVMNVNKAAEQVARGASDLTMADINRYRKRLQSAAGEVKFRQISALRDRGDWEEHDFDLSDIVGYQETVDTVYPTYDFTLEEDSTIRGFRLKALSLDTVELAVRVELEILTPRTEAAKRMLRDGSWLIEESPVEEPEKIEADSSVAQSIEDYIVSRLREDTGAEEDLALTELPGISFAEIEEAVEEDAYEDSLWYQELHEFGVGYFDFPMIDNTRLVGIQDQRLAIVVTDWPELTDGDSSVRIEAICFPGPYASLKEKPFYDDIVENILPDKFREDEGQ